MGSIGDEIDRLVNCVAGLEAENAKLQKAHADHMRVRDRQERHRLRECYAAAIERCLDIADNYADTSRGEACAAAGSIADEIRGLLPPAEGGDDE